MMIFCVLNTELGPVDFPASANDKISRNVRKSKIFEAKPKGGAIIFVSAKIMSHRL